MKEKEELWQIQTTAWEQSQQQIKSYWQTLKQDYLEKTGLFKEIEEKPHHTTTYKEIQEQLSMLQEKIKKDQQELSETQIARTEIS